MTLTTTRNNNMNDKNNYNQKEKESSHKNKENKDTNEGTNAMLALKKIIFASTNSTEVGTTQQQASRNSGVSFVWCCSSEYCLPYRQWKYWSWTGKGSGVCFLHCALKQFWSKQWLHTDDLSFMFTTNCERKKMTMIIMTKIMMTNVQKRI